MPEMRRLTLAAIVFVVAGAVSVRLAAAPAGQAAAPAAPLNIIAFGAHPDDCDIRAGGTAAKWAAAGHRVRFVSVTNGDAGHQSQGGGALAARRRAEAQEAGRRIGVEYIVLDNHDGELMPSCTCASRSSGSSGSGKPTSCSGRGRTTTIPTTDTPACSCRTPRSW